MADDKQKSADSRPEIHQSEFRLYSMGTAASNLTPGSTMLDCYPIEALPYRNGEINAERTNLNHSGKDAFGNDYSVSVATSNVIRAEWCPFRSNRLTAPNIRRGEHIAILRYADVDKYYWVERGRLDDLGLRRLETVIWGFSNTRDESVKALDASNSWLVEISTHTKQASLRTNKSDGEQFAYLVQVNAKDGNVTIMDDAGNWIQMNSAGRRFEFHNADNTEIILDKKDMILNGIDTITHNTKKYTINCTDYIINASNSITEKTQTYATTTATYALNASTSATVTTPTYALNAASMITFTTPTFNGIINASNFGGTVFIGGLATFAAGMAAPAPMGSATPTASFAIPMSITGTSFAVSAPTNFTGGVKANNVPIDDTHTHTSEAPGIPTSTPIA